MMVNYAELDLRISTYNNDVAQRNLPAWHGTAQRATYPGTLATKVKTMVSRVITHNRHVSAPATTGTAHS
jgi:hypothetical protein